MRYSTIWTVAAGLLLLAGCDKVKEDYSNGPGTEIVFGASTIWENGLETRTEYSGEDENGLTVSSGSDYERIDWVAGSDRIRILCDAAVGKASPGNKVADYAVTGVQTGTDKEKSEADIEPADANSLQWGTGTHYFYALYPAPGMASNYAFTDRTISSSNARIESVTGNKARITGVIPAAQEAVKVGNEYKANMNYAYMYASATATPGQAGAVVLSFNPLVTALEVNLARMASDPTAENLTRVELSSSSTPLTGTFEATVDGTGSTPAVSVSAPSFSAGTNDRITITLPSPGVALTDTPVKVTFLTLPVSQTDLTLTLYFGSSYAVKRTVKLNTGTGPVAVSAGRKAYFHFGVPNSVYYIDATGPVIMQGDELFKGGKRTVQVSSYANQTGTPSSRAVSWEVYASTDGGMNYYSHGQAGWPSWLTLSAYSGPGSVASAGLEATVSYNPLISGTVSDVATEGNGANMISTLRNATPVTGPRDLSLYNIYGELHSASTVPAGITASGPHTANTYVVSAPGSYCFPIVYGNAIDKTHGDANGVYADAYGGTWGTRIHNASGRNIGSPYILSDGNLDKTGSYEAVLLWQDVQTGWEMLHDVDLSIVDAPAGAGVPGCKYIRFYLDPARILPGNFVIALRDTGLGRILWSWHIWVTAVPHGSASDDFSIRTFKYRTIIYWPPAGSNGGVPTGNDPPAGSQLVNTSMLNCNVGWTPPLAFSEARTSPRSALLKFVQDEGTPSPKYAIVEVRQDEGCTEPYTGVYYGNTYYQWGRKDPFLPARGDCVDPADYAGVNRCHSDGESFPGMTVVGERTVYKGDLAQNPGLMIREPNKFDTNTSGGNNGMNYLWNAKYMNNGMDLDEFVVWKTVNDPCPAGFTVPFGYAFTGFTRDGYHRDSPVNPTTPTHYLDFFGNEIAAQTGKGWPGGFMMTETGQQNASDYTLYFPYTGFRGSGNSGGADDATYIWNCCTLLNSLNGQCFASHHNIFPLYDRLDRLHGLSVRPLVEQ